MRILSLSTHGNDKCAFTLQKGFPGGSDGKESACNADWSDPWVGKIPQEEEIATPTVFLHGESPCTEEPGRLQSRGSQRVGHD